MDFLARQFCDLFYAAITKIQVILCPKLGISSRKFKHDPHGEVFVPDTQTRISKQKMQNIYYNKICNQW